MQPELWIAAGLAVAFLSGLMANGIYVARTRAFNPAQENSIADERNGASSVAVTRTHLVQPKPVYVSNPAPISRPVYQTQKKRTWQKEALIIGEAPERVQQLARWLAVEREPASVHLSGGIAGIVYDLATRNK